MDILKRLLLILGIITGVTLSLPMVFADDNEITIKQEGNNFELDITQIGYRNVVRQWTASEGIKGLHFRPGGAGGTQTFGRKPIN